MDIVEARILNFRMAFPRTIEVLFSSLKLESGTCVRKLELVLVGSSNLERFAANLIGYQELQKGSV